MARGARTGERVGGRQAEVVLAVRREHDAVGALNVAPQVGDQATKLVRKVPARRVGDVERRRARPHDGGQDAVEELRLRAARVLRRELDVLAAKRLEVRDGRHRGVDDLVLRHPQLELHVDGRRGDEGVHARQRRALHRLPRALDVRGLGAGEAADDGDVAVGRDVRADDVRDLLHRRKVVRRRDREARLDDVDAQLCEVARDLELLARRQRRARRLLAVAQRRVKDADVVRVVDSARHVRRPPRRIGRRRDAATSAGTRRRRGGAGAGRSAR